MTLPHEEIGSFFTFKSPDNLSLHRFTAEEQVLTSLMDDLLGKNRSAELFALDVLLKGIRSFYHLGNHPKRTRNKWNLVCEAAILEEVFRRIRQLYCSLFGIQDLDAFVSFVEKKFRISLEYLMHLEEGKRGWSIQDWIKSFGVIINEMELLNGALARLERVSYREFIALGDHFLLEVIRNPYIYPLVRRSFRVQLHRMVFPRISNLIHSMADRERKYYVGVNLLQAFKILRTVDILQCGPEDSEKISYFLVVHIRSEVEIFLSLLDSPVPSPHSQELKDTLVKVYDLILANVNTKKGKSKEFEKAKALLTRTIRKIVITLLQTVDPNFREEELFPQYKDELTLQRELYDKLLENEEFLNKTFQEPPPSKELKEALLCSLKTFEAQVLLHLPLRFWERFYRLYFALSQTTHRFQMASLGKEVQGYLKEVRESLASGCVT